MSDLPKYRIVTILAMITIIGGLGWINVRLAKLDGVASEIESQISVVGEDVSKIRKMIENLTEPPESVPITNVFGGTEPYTRSINIPERHWLWMKRIALDDLKFVPAEGTYDVTEEGVVILHESIRQLYADCEIELSGEEKIFYSIPNTTMLVRATPSTFQKMADLHDKIRLLDRALDE